MKNLISMTDFVLERTELELKKEKQNFKDLGLDIYAYANFLKQPLKLEMFVPCDENGNVLTKSTMSENTCEDDCNHKTCVSEMNECIKYQQAKEKVLFYSQHGDKELFDVSLAKVYLDEFFNIEELANEIGRIKLTKTAIKQIGLCEIK